MPKVVAILQSNYIPWKGYFDIIGSVDEFIIYDDAQYTRSDWRNRNKIKTPAGPAWLTIPVRIKGRLGQRIRDTEVDGTEWAQLHWKSIRQNYGKAAFFKKYGPAVEEWYAGADSPLLSEINAGFLRSICGLLGIETKLTWSHDYELSEGKTERLVSLCRQAGASVYLSGPAAQQYIEPARFAEAGIELRYMDYSGYPVYRQLYPPFEHGVTILDLLFSEGGEARKFLKLGRQSCGCEPILPEEVS